MTSKFRIDRFAVPAAHLLAFRTAVEATHEVLRVQPGFRRDLIVAKPLPDCRHEVLTLAEWDEAADVEAVSVKVRAAQAARGFDTKAALAEWGVTADLGWYQAA